MAIAAVLVGKGNSTTGNPTTAAGNTAASGSTFVYLVSFDANNPGAVPTDNKSNLYVQKATTLTTGHGEKLAVYVCENGTGGTGHTATQALSGFNSFAATYLVEITGATTAPTDIALTGTDTTSPFTVATGTLAQANEVVLTLCAANQGVSSTNTYSSSNTTILSQESDGSTYWTSAISALNVTSTTTVSPSFTDTQGTAAGLIVLTFKEASTGTVALTGQSATFSAGTITPSGGGGTVALTGQSATFSAGTLTAQSTTVGVAPARFDLFPIRGPLNQNQYRPRPAAFSSAATLSLTGQSATLTAGTATPSTTIALTGASATLTAGTVSPGVQVALTGQSATLTAGSVFAASQIIVTGQSATFAAGTVSPNGAGSVALTGQSAAFTVGTLVPSVQVAITGQSSTFAAGSMSPVAQRAATGSSATFSAGLLSSAIQIPVVGQSATFTAGNVTAPNGVTLALTGQVGSFTPGSIVPSATVSLTGQPAAASAGTLTVGNAHALAGSAITSAPGTLLSGLTAALTGQQALFVGGLVLPPGDKTAALLGSTATFQAGTVLPIGAILSGTPRYVIKRRQKRIFTVSAVTYSQFPPKDPAEAVKLEFDFADDLDTGVLLSGTPVVTVTMNSGADPAPTTILNGLPRFDVTSTQVIVPVVGGIDDCDYDVKVVVPTTDSLTILALSGILPVRA